MSNLPHNQSPEDQSPEDQSPEDQLSNEFLHQLGELLRAAVANAVQQGNLENFKQQNLEQQAMIDFGEYLVAARTQQHLSSSEFARFIGTTQAYLHALEQGLLPRKAVGDQLLARIATIVGDECEILSLILGDVATVAPAFTGFNTLSSRSAPSHQHQLRSVSRKSRQGKQQVGGNWQALYGRSFVATVQTILWTSLQVGRYRNLLDRLQPSRLAIGHIAPKRMIVMVTVCCLTVLWIGGMASGHLWFVGHNDGTIQSGSAEVNWPSTSIAQSTVATVQQPSLSTPPAVAVEGATFVDHSHVTTTTGLPISIVQGEYHQRMPGQQRFHQISAEESLTPSSGQRIVSTLDRRAYRIVYTERNATKQYTAPYIIVNDEQVALIQFQTPEETPGSQHCINSGRFDLCPI